MDRGTQILTQANILIAIKNGATDEEIYNISAAFTEDRVQNLITSIKISCLDHKIRFLAEFLAEKFPDNRQELIMQAIRMSGEWENKVQTEHLLAQYTNEYGEDLDVLIEKLSYYLKYYPKKLDKIEELATKVKSKMEGEA